MTRVIRAVPGSPLSEPDAQTVGTAIRACKIVAFPTDTVYGLGVTGLVKAASRRIYQIKGRDSGKPLPVLVATAAEAKRWVVFTPQAEALASRFWPGPLTLVLRPTPEGRLLTFAEYPTVGIRVPAHPVALQLLAASGVPWSATSANMSGEPALNDGEEVARRFEGLADIVIVAETTPGVESTVVDATESRVRILREGALPRARLLELLGEPA